MRVLAAGVNYVDVYHRSGLYPSHGPVLLGEEGAGVVEEVGPQVSDVRVGNRVAWVHVSGSYATHVVAPVERLVPIPDGLDVQKAAAAMLQGMTAHYLARSTYPLGSKDVCLVHAAAGGVGLLLTQLAKRAGARVLGTVGSTRKAELARAHGTGEAILYNDLDFEAEVRRLTSGRGVDVVYDSVGKTTFEKSLASLRPRGMLVSFGQSSGAVPAFEPLLLSQKGSLFFTRPTLRDYVATRAELLKRAGDVLSWVLRGELSLTISGALPLADAAEAHRLLEGRKTVGKLLLLP